MPAFAATYTVSNTADAGAGTLRQALLQANEDPGSTITFSVTGTITLASSLPPIIENLTITGPGAASLTIDGNNVGRVFTAIRGTIAISGLTVQGGNAIGGAGGGAEVNRDGGGGGGGMGAGGGLFVNNLATVTLTNVPFVNNRATGGSGGGFSTGTPGAGNGGGGGGLGGAGATVVTGGATGGGGVFGAGGVGSTGGGGGGGLSGPGGNGSFGGGGGGGMQGAAGGATGAGGAGSGNPGTALGGGGGGSDTLSGGAGANTAGAGGGGSLTQGGGGGGGGNGGSAGQAFGAGANGGNGGFGGGGGGGGSGGAGGNGGVGGGGGGGTNASPGAPGGAGGDLAGGGGGTGPFVGGAGGFGGGGGGGGANPGSTGGAGGFGGGGGAGRGTGGASSTFGGAGGTTGGGGGGALGGAIFVRSGGTLIIDGTTVSGGTVTAGLSAGNGGSGAAVGAGFYLHGNVTLNGANNATISDVMAGTGALTKAGASTLTLSGANTYTGGTTVSAGLLIGTTASLQGSIANSAIVRFDQATAGSYAGVLSGTGRLEKLGVGTVTLANSQTYTGLTLVDTGTLRLGSGATLAPVSYLQVNTGSTVDLNGNDQTVGRLVSTGGSIVLGGATLTVNQVDDPTTAACVISGIGGGFIKAGSGGLILSGTNTYTGTTSVNAGRLIVTGSISAVSTVAVQTGALIGGTGTIGGSMAVANNAIMDPGNGGIGTLSVGSMTWHGSTTSTPTAQFELSTVNNTSDRLAVTGAFSKGAGPTFRFNFQGGGASNTTYTLATFGSTTFTAADFSYVNLAPGLTGGFSIVGGNTLVFTIVPPPVINSAATASGTYGAGGFSYAITATNSPTSYSITAGTLPAGLTLDSTSGVISGTPGQAGTFNVTIGATNPGGTGTQGLAITIGAATVTPSITVGAKIYDRTNAATITGRSLTGVVGADDVTLTGGLATFASTGVGTGITVTATGLSLAGTTAANYQLSSTSATTTADITAATVTPVVTIANKAYDGTTAATISGRSLTGVVAGDVGNVVLTGGTAAFADANTGTGKTVTVTGLSLTGAAAVNYQLSSTTATATADISSLTVTPSVTVSSKTYDGSTSATIATRSLAGVVPADVGNVSLSGGTATFDSATPGTGKVVTITGLTLSGSAASRYTLSSTSTTATADITPGGVGFLLGNLNFTYDGQPKPVSVTVTPNVAHTITYGGSTTPPTNAGHYPVMVLITDSNYMGAIGGELVIEPARATVSLGSLSQTANGSPRSVTTTTTPAGLPVRVTYNGATTAPTDAGTYAVVATLSDPNYAGTAEGTLTITGLGPVITRQPAGATVSSGAVVSLSVQADTAGGGALRYQWQRNGAPVAGATSATLALDGVRRAQAGSYTVVVTNDLGSVTSSPATVTVNAGVFAGSYFGTLGSGQGTWSMIINRDGSGKLLLYVLNPHSGYIIVVTINEDGDFSGVGAALAAGGADVATLGDRVVAAAGGPDAVVTGRIVDGTVTGSTGPLGLSIQGKAGTPETTPAASATGSSTGVAATTVSVIVGGGGQAFVLAGSGGNFAAGTGTIGAGGALSVTLDNGAVVAGTLAPGGALTGTITQGGTTTTFTGAADGADAVRRLVNVATRGTSGTGDNAMIAGFVIGGTGPRQVLIRAAGPALGGLGVSGFLTQTTLELLQGETRLAQNQGWSTAANATDMSTAAAGAGAFAFAANSGDSAILTSLNPGSYTAIARGVNNTTGISLVEVYEIGAAGTTRLVNLSTRGSVGTGDNVLIAGLVIGGNVPKRVLVRGIGPALAGFGVGGTLADPQLRIMQGATQIATNDNWGGDTAISTAAAQVAAFALPAASRDAALVVTLAPGAYTAVVSGVGTATGVALVEVYELP